MPRSTYIGYRLLHMRLILTYILLVTLSPGKSSGGPLVDPSLLSMMKTNSVSNCKVLVQFRGPLSKNAWNNIIAKQPAKALTYVKEKFADDFLLSKLDIRNIFWLNHTIHINLSLDQLRNLQTRSDVVYITLDREIKMQASKMHKHADLMRIRDSESISHALKSLQIPQVWNQMKTKGTNIRIGLLGRSFSAHPDLRNESITFRDFSVGGEYSQMTQDDTHFLGLMGAGSLSGRPLGVAPDAHFIIAGVFDRQSKTTLSVILKALQWMVNPDLDTNTRDGVHLISNSWGWTVQHMAAEKPIWDATVALRKMGVVNIFPAGDEGPKLSSILSPAAYPHVIAVGAVDRQLNNLNYSSRGPVRWEDVIYKKPDFMAPGDYVESSLPSAIYGKLSGTSVATALAAGSLALIKQSNSKLSWQDVLKISKQTTLAGPKHDKKLDNTSGILQVYDATRLASRGAKISVYIESPFDEAGEVIILSKNNRKFNTNSMGYVEFFLSEGSYRVAFYAPKCAPEVREIKIKSNQNQNFRIQLQKAEITNLSLTVTDTKARRLPAVIDFFNEVGQTFVGVSQPMRETLPEGVYPVRIKSRGYRSMTTSIIHRKFVQNKQFELKIMPAVALIDDDGDQHSQLKISRSLNEMNIKHDLIRSPNHLEEIEAYQILIWHLGNSVHRTLDKSEQLILTEYLSRGGSILISGQDSAYSLQSTQFLNKALGVQFEKDHSGDFDLKYNELILQLAGDSGARNQFFVDALRPKGNDSRCLISYNNGMCAGVLRYHPNGKSLLLGFGLEGLNNKNRKLLLKELIQDLKPAIEHLLDKIEKTYLNNRASYFQIMKSLETFEPEFALKASQQIESRRRKSTWRPLLYDILHDRRRHIFDQLYDVN